eukprot:2871287-Amphidinium_carterae.1
MDRGDGQDRFIFSGSDGRWYFGTAEQRAQEFKCATGYICFPLEHDGRMPYRIEGVWSWWDGLRWQADPAIVVTTDQVVMPEDQDLSLQALKRHPIKPVTLHKACVARTCPGGESVDGIVRCRAV